MELILGLMLIAFVVAVGILLLIIHYEILCLILPVYYVRKGHVTVVRRYFWRFAQQYGVERQGWGWKTPFLDRTKSMKKWGDVRVRVGNLGNLPNHGNGTYVPDDFDYTMLTTLDDVDVEVRCIFRYWVTHPCHAIDEKFWDDLYAHAHQIFRKMVEFRESGAILTSREAIEQAVLEQLNRDSRRLKWGLRFTELEKFYVLFAIKTL